jgi:Cu(I)/Ag(I) efflux system membrane protein CusA/SilA
MRRIAVPMVGGMISSTILTLLVIPAIYAQVKIRALRAPLHAGIVAELQAGE